MRNRRESHVISNGHEAQPIATRPEHFERRAPDQSPSSRRGERVHPRLISRNPYAARGHAFARRRQPRRYQRSEEHTSELQSHSDLVCRLLLEKKKKKTD